MFSDKTCFNIYHKMRLVEVALLFGQGLCTMVKLFFIANRF
ncbi:unnamed protein product [Acanthoscelides obtectus]|uniref:Uncharacterized protein n=1 Tax=Acanthoscelides obtectus TaxID=200917 RepID=A0A9P0KUT2_ACAOB|nr:unnamed protein product [Acanthoscelides obtectus]CAK1642332.1 hypothetical protein AOBTE_LOCUS12980 [Acanthoscelides obtectus]